MSFDGDEGTLNDDIPDSDDRTGPQQPEGEAQPARRPAWRRKRTYGVAIFLLLVMAVGVLGVHYALYARAHPSTDDANIDGDMYSVSSRINGRVLEVYVSDNEFVRAGQPLIDLDPADLSKQLLEARAALSMEIANARAAGENITITRTTTGAATGQAVAGVQSARAQTEVARRQADTGRMQIESARAGIEVSRATVQDTETGVRVAEAGITAAEAAQSAAEAGIRAARDQVSGADAGVRAAAEGVNVAAADVTAAKANARRANQDIRRARTLFANSAIAQSQLDAAEATATTADAGVDAAQQRENAAKAQLDQARANLAATKSGLSQATSRRDQAAAAVKQARATHEGARSGVDVAQAKARQSEIAEQQSHKTLAELQAGVRQRQAGISLAQAAQRGTEAAPQQVAASAYQADSALSRVQQAQAKIDELELQLSYTKITAPHDGWVSQKNVTDGQAVQQAQPLMAVVDLANIFVTANYKETQLHGVKVGDPAEFSVDSYPGVHFQGHVESLSPSTGSVFALLPPENATGNFTKIVQRVPIRIAIDGQPDPEHPLRLGMSVITKVSIR